MSYRGRLLRRRDRKWLLAAAGLGLAAAAFVHPSGGSSTAAVPASAAPSPAATAAAAPAPAGISGNVATGQQLASSYGWASGPQWDCLYDLWQQESGWSNTAENPSDAYGIAQALGHGPTNQYPAGSAANPPTSSASAQISWGLNYIAFGSAPNGPGGRPYGTPCNAWSHEETDGWY